MPSQPRRFPRLPAHEERLQLALDAGAIAGTWFWDVVNDLFTSDRRFARYFSLDEARLEAGVPLREVVQSIHPDDEPGVQRRIQAALAKGGAYRAEYRVRHPGGRYRWVEANGTVTLDDQGRALTFPGVLVDIHRRKTTEQMQRELLRLSDRLRELDGPDDILHTVSAACGTALDASRTGYGVVDPVEDMVDITCDWRRPGTHSIVGVYRFRDFGSFIDDLRAGRIVAIPDVLADPRTAPHGEAFAPLGIRALLNVPLRRAGQLLGVLIVHDAAARAWTAEEIDFASNVADRTWAALATAQAASRLRTLNDDVEREVASRAADRTLLWTMTRDLMFVAKLGGTLTAANPAWTATLGWDEAELLGRNLLELVHPDDQPLTRENAERIRHGQAVSNFENRCRHKDGGYRWIAWNAGPGNGFIVGAGRDVSAARELALAQEQLRQSQKMEAVGQLTGGVAHDFNNLLTVIGTSVSLLKSERISPEQRARSLEAISKTVKRASRLTAQLLAFARRQALSPVVFDASQNVGAVAEMLGTLVGARIEVQTRLSPGCFIDADPSQFDTALVNLAVNARDAMDGAGWMRIEVSRADRVPAVRLHPAVEGDFVAVSVADSGTGISKENLARIFEPFFTTKALGQGTGLGLSQVFGFAKQSGGDVTVESEPGNGATFTMYFPLASVAAADGAEEVDAAARLDTPDGGLLLVVEDNLDVAQAVESSLRALGYRTEWVSNAAAALARLGAGASHFTAVFSDVVMAGMDGIEMAREIRARWPTLPVVLSSGDSHVLANDSSHGFDLLAKPYELDTLALTLKRAIDRAGAPRVPVPREGLTTETVQSMLDETGGETARQAALDAMQVLDTPPETAFDDLVRMAADICETPIALVSLIDADRQWFKARVGLQAQQTPREHAFCAHAIKTPQRLMVVEDAQSDPRFADNPLVTGDPNIRFYAGAPLVDDSGQALGTLCVISPQPRGLQPRQAELLEHLAAQVVKRLQQRRDRLHGATDER